MIEVPWYMLSPSPYSLTVWFFLAYFQARKLGAHSIKEWLYSISLCAFSLGYVILPFDSLWIIFQVARFGYLHPDEMWITLFTSLARNGLIFLLCWYETRELKDILNWKALQYLTSFIPIFLVWFWMAPDPSWTDWTYAYRFGYGIARTFNAFVISHVMMKGIQAIIFWDLWRDKF